MAATSGRGRRPGDQHVERAVLVVVVEDAVGGEQRRKQQRHPQHAGCDARQKIEVGAEAERRDGDDDEIEAESDTDSAAFAEGELHVADKQGEGGAHATRSLPPSASLSREFGLERRVARHERDAAGLEMILQRGVEQLDRSGVERDLRLVEQPDRARRGEQARERELPLLARREETGGKLGKGLKPEGGKRAVETSRRPRQETPPKRRGSRAR